MAMRKETRFLRHIGLLTLLLYTLISPTGSPAAGRIGNTVDSHSRLARESDEPEANSQLLVELFLAKNRKGDLETIKKEFEAFGITRIRTQFFRMGNPPENIAIGKAVPADVARMAIRVAITYNRDIKFLLPEFRFFPDHIVIGSSAYDEKSQIPIRPEDLKKLSDPALTTVQFHELYRHLTGEDKRFETD